MRDNGDNGGEWGMKLRDNGMKLRDNGDNGCVELKLRDNGDDGW